MKKSVLLKLSESAHKTLKDEANDKGMKFYSYLESLLESDAKRLEKKK